MHLGQPVNLVVVLSVEVLDRVVVGFALELLYDAEEAVRHEYAVG